MLCKECHRKKKLMCMFRYNCLLKENLNAVINLCLQAEGKHTDSGCVLRVHVSACVCVFGFEFDVVYNTCV